MAIITRQDVNKFWYMIPGNSWSATRQALQKPLALEYFSNSTITDLLPIINKIEAVGEPFPETPNQLYDLIMRYS